MLEGIGEPVGCLVIHARPRVQPCGVADNHAAPVDGQVSEPDRYRPVRGLGPEKTEVDLQGRDAPQSNTGDESREELKQRLAEAKAKRDKTHEEVDRLREAAEKKFWTTVQASLDGAYHGAQRDATEVLGYTRDHILKKTKHYGK